MAYADYDFYKRKYMGNVIAEADFPRLAERASNKLDYLTANRIKVVGDTFVRMDYEITVEPWVESKIKSAVCAIAEKLNDLGLTETAMRAAGGAGVKSVSSGSESITFAGVSAEAKASVDREIYSIAREYLGNTGLLYCGI